MLNAVVVLVCVFIWWRAGVSEQEAATVAEAAPAPEAPAGTAADSEPKDTETEESVS